jgi:hypothetical protein
MKIKNKYKEYKRRCRNKGLDFSISLWKFEFYTQRPCYICKKEKAGGLDRVDNNLGYIEKNIYPCCFDCNRMKSNKSVIEFKEYLSRLNKDHPLLSGFNKLNNYDLYEKKRKSLHKIIIDNCKH